MVMGGIVSRLHVFKNVCCGKFAILSCLFTLLFPTLLFATFQDIYTQSFAEKFKDGHFHESLDLLDEWERVQPTDFGRILGMRAAVYLAMGELEKSQSLMSDCIQHLEIDRAADPSLDYMISLFYQALDNDKEISAIPNTLATLCEHSEHKQPTGLKIKYWFGIGQIIIGILTAPFNAGTSTALILTGIGTVVDAASDAIDNKTRWERDLNSRQNIRYLSKPSIQLLHSI